MIVALGAAPVLCAPFGGEAGVVLRALLEAEDVVVRSIGCHGENGGYVHDRRGGERHEIALQPSARLTRHEHDELYGMALTTALECGVAVLTGPAQESVLGAGAFRRFALDAGRNGVQIVADLSLAALRALEGGIAVLKVSHEELIAAGFAADARREQLIAGMRTLRESGMRAVLEGVTTLEEVRRETMTL